MGQQIREDFDGKVTGSVVAPSLFSSFTLWLTPHLSPVGAVGNKPIGEKM